MLIYKNNEWTFANFVITIVNDGKVEIHHSNSKTYYTDMAAKHNHIEVISMDEFIPADNLVARLEEVKNYPETCHAEVVKYISEGVVELDGPLKELALTKKIKDQEAVIDALILDSLGGV